MRGAAYEGTVLTFTEARPARGSADRDNFLMTSLSDKAGFLIVANLIKYAVGFVMPMVLVRMLSREDYGTYQQLNLIGMMGIAILVLGLPNSVYYFYDRRNAARDKVLTIQTSAVLLASGALTAVLLMIGTPLAVSLMKNATMAPLLPWYAAGLGLLIASEHFVQFMIAHDQLQDGGGRRDRGDCRRGAHPRRAAARGLRADGPGHRAARLRAAALHAAQHLAAGAAPATAQAGGEHWFSGRSSPTASRSA
jgi:hypothetical protein